jgi:hypothetical protein
MSVTQIDLVSGEVDVNTASTCDNCGNVSYSELQEDQTQCSFCDHRVDATEGHQEATIPIRYIGGKDNLREIADLYDERATNTRRLYEEGWTTDSYVDAPNVIRAIPQEEAETSEEREPITDEQWAGGGTELSNSSSGVGLIEYVCDCPHCNTEMIRHHDEWNDSHEFADEDELFCMDCEKAVPKNLTIIQFSEYPKFQFQHPDSLRSVAFRLRGLACWFRDLRSNGWYLDEVRDQYVYIRYNVDSTDDITVDSDGHLQSVED